MEVIKVLDLLNKIKGFHGMEYNPVGEELLSFKDLINLDVSFTHSIDFGVLYVNERSLTHYSIIDGQNRLIAVSLLLHAVCECYKKTTAKNAKAIETIRAKYLLSSGKLRLILNPADNTVYEKIISGERLSGKEKNNYLFKLLHYYWSEIKQHKYNADKILSVLHKIRVFVVETDKELSRELFYTLNRNRNVNQNLLINSYMQELKLYNEWEKIKETYGNKEEDIKQFFKDFLVTKFGVKAFNENLFYENILNYFSMMLTYIPKAKLIENVKRSAELYKSMLYVKLPTKELTNAFLQIRLHGGEDTYAYLLNVYEDYIDKNLNEATFLEILSTVDEYLQNRLKNPTEVSFNQLIEYLNAFISCK